MNTEEIDRQIQAQHDRIGAAALRKLDAMEAIERDEAEIAEGRAIVAGLQFARSLIPVTAAKDSANTISPPSSGDGVSGD